MTIRLFIVLACTFLAVSACVVNLAAVAGAITVVAASMAARLARLSNAPSSAPQERLIIP